MPGFFAQPAVKHGPMSQYRREAFIVIVDGKLWVSLTPTIHELLHTLQVFARFTIGLARLADDDTLYLLTLDIRLQPLE